MINEYNKRQLFFTNPRLQWFIICYSFFIGILSCTILLLGAHFVFVKYKLVALKAGVPEGHFYFTYIEQQEKMIFILFLVIIPIIFLLTFFVGFKFSQKISGPIYKLTQELKGFNSTGVLPIVKFRKGDYFLELEEEINILLQKNAKD